uniref:Uncharacterized protein n=1 Tax=Periophthalmus magnuspinnatus TaxID=409849 RepID=A0A3B4AH92_9GOBI
MTEETCQEQRGEGNEINMKRPLSITALSTIAVQSGQMQIVVSVLKSGSSVHLQLVHVEPGLCEIGSNQEENQTLIREQKQLLGKLQVQSTIKPSHRFKAFGCFENLY